jgi:hypothetical protein
MSERVPPIVVHLGKKKRKELKQLERGEGRLVDEVEEAMAQVAAGLGAKASSRELVPVVVVYTKKEKNGGRLRLPFLPF